MFFIHVADIHCNRERKNKCMKVLETIKKYIEEHKDTRLIVAGDFWDAPVTNAETSGFSDFLTIMKDIINLTPVYMVYGTPSHEANKSLQPFKLLGAHVYDKNTFEEFDDFELIALPEPRKSEFASLIKNESLEEYIEKYNEDFINSIPEKKKPRIVILHNEILGEKYQNGQDCTSKLGIRKSWLNKLNADYIACGHIHTAYEVPEVKNCWYSGSCPPKDFGETLDAGFNLVEITE